MLGEGLSLFLGYLFIVVGVLVSVAFMVLFERRILGYIQIRRGPNKVGFTGILQSFGDAVKLFVKEQTFPLVSNFFLFYLSPVLSLFVMMMVWVVIPFGRNVVTFVLGVLFFLGCTGFGVYTLMARGWSSNRNYSLLGAMRAVAQTISYEVSLALILLRFVFLVRRFRFMEFFKFQENVWFIFLNVTLFFCWLGSILAETNRTPFDFAEGESELVSGFNIEYGRGGFALLFLAEYGRIIFIRYLLAVVFFGAGVSSVFFHFLGCFFCYWFIWVRGTLPRFRYDKLIYVAWRMYLPVSLNLILFSLLIKYV
jgi:NADH-ubiquinone oxidoreductase chain 1